MHDLSLYLLEILENSVRAEASRVHIVLTVDQEADEVRLTVDDDGQGLPAAPEEVLDPFFTTKPGKKTGLGLSLLRSEAQTTGGDLTIGPSPSLGGTRVAVSMRLSHIDCPPLGDMGASLVVAAATNPQVEFTVTFDGDRFSPPLLQAAPAVAAQYWQQACSEKHKNQEKAGTNSRRGRGVSVNTNLRLTGEHE